MTNRTTLRLRVLPHGHNILGGFEFQSFCLASRSPFCGNFGQQLILMNRTLKLKCVS